MINTELARKELEKQKDLSFEEIWNLVKESIKIEISKKREDFSDEQIKSDFYLSMLKDFKLLMIGENKWSLRKNYTLEQIHEIETNIFGEELNK